METLCDDILRSICKRLISLHEFQLLMVNKHLRYMALQHISEAIESITHVSSLRLHNLCVRASSCLPLIKLNKSTRKNRLVSYTGDRVRSSTRFVLAQWNYLDKCRVFPVSRKRANSLMLNYHQRGVIWDLDLNDNFRKPPEALFFIQNLNTIS